MSSLFYLQVKNSINEKVLNSQRLFHVHNIAKNQPVTLNMGMKMPSWYDIKSLTDRADDTCDGINDSSEYIAGLIQKEVSL